MFLKCNVIVVLLILLSVMFYFGFMIFVNDLKSRNLVSFNISKKDSIFNKVKDSKRPIHVPKFMLEIYEKNKIYEKRDKNYDTPDIVRSLVPSHTETNEVVEELSDRHILIFNLPDQNQNERLVYADLKILTEIKINSIKEEGVKKSIKISLYDENQKTFIQLNQTQIHHFNNTWLSFNLTKHVDNILNKNSSKKTLKLYIEVSSFFRHAKNNLKLSLMPKNKNTDHDYPILLLYYTVDTKINLNKTNSLETDRRRKEKDENELVNDTKDKLNINIKENRRTKRNTQEIEYDEEETNQIWNDLTSGHGLSILNKRNKNTCRKRPLYVDFAEIQYDMWILQPSGYEAYQCQGRCFYPVAQHLTPTKHAIMQALVHSVSPLKASRSCCVPTILDSISILYVDDKGVLTYRYAYMDMVVKECGCR